MSLWRPHDEHGPPGPRTALGWVHPKTGHVLQSTALSHARQASELGFSGDREATGWLASGMSAEVSNNAVKAGYTRYYTTRDEIGVHFNKDCPDAPTRAKETLAYHAQNQQGRMLLADTGVDYYHGTSLKDAHDFIDRVSSGRKETDYVRMKRELGEAFNVKINDPHKLKLKQTHTEYDPDTELHDHEFEVWHPKHGAVATLAGRANDPEPGYHGINIGMMYLHPNFAARIGASDTADYKHVVGALGVAGIRQVGRELRRHGFTHVRTDSRESGVRGRPGNKQGKLGGYIDDMPLPETADTLIRMALNESVHSSIRKAFRSNSSYQLLDADPEIKGSTWASGGCGVAARALHKVMGGEIKSVVDQHGVHHHAVLHHNGRFYDMDGEHTEAKMLGKMARREGVKNPRLAPFDQSKYKGRVETVDALAAHLGGLNESALDESLSPDEAKKLTVKLDPDMLGVDSQYSWYHIHHADHGKIGEFSGKVTDGHLNVQNMGLDKEYLQKQGVHIGSDYGNWWSSADVARDHKIASNHLGVAGVRQIARELKQKHGINSINSTERVTGTRLKAYARGRGVPRASIKSFVTKTRSLGESMTSRADTLIRRALNESYAAR